MQIWSLKKHSSTCTFWWNRSFDVSQDLCKLCTSSLLESVFTFSIVAWCGNLGVKGRANLAHIVGKAGKIIGAKQVSQSDLCFVSTSILQGKPRFKWLKTPLLCSVSNSPIRPMIQTTNYQEEHLEEKRFYFLF